MIRNFFILILVAAFATIFASLFLNYGSSESLTPLATYYAENGAAEVGAPNLVTSIVVTYRGFDTLGEVTILFVVASVIGFFLKKTKHSNEQPSKRESSEIIVTASKVLVPVIIVLGIYVFINGHLTPGGGFQGGSIVATAFIMLLMANPAFEINHRFVQAVESISGMGFVLMGVFGLLLAGGFLDNRFLPPGTFGNIFSAGAIPVIYSLIGLKVGSEMSNILSNFQAVQNEKM